MALTDDTMGSGSGMVMPVAPMYGGNGGNGFMGGEGWWILLLFILLGNGAWGGFGGGFGAGADAGLYPWMNQSNQINGGFRDQMINSSVQGIQNSVTAGFGDVQNSLCAGFAGVNASINGAQNAIAQQMYTNQISDLERSFAAQTAQTAGMNAMQAQLAQCCCDNRAATADLKYTVATENCADRAASYQNTRDIIDSQTRGTQAILDKLCALELDGVKNQLAQAQRDNVGLQNQLNMANLAASQAAQNAFIQQGFSNEVDALYNRLSNCPVPSTPVYGRTPIFTCNNGGCGCGCGGAMA
jgi:hypothetical protein